MFALFLASFLFSKHFNKTHIPWYAVDFLPKTFVQYTFLDFVPYIVYYDGLIQPED